MTEPLIKAQKSWQEIVERVYKEKDPSKLAELTKELLTALNTDDTSTPPPRA